MDQRIKLISIIVEIYVAVFNLHLQKFKLKKFIAAVIITEIISSFFYVNGWEYATVISYLLMSIIFMYLYTRNLIVSIIFSIAGFFITIIWDYILQGMYVYVFSVELNVVKTSMAIYWMSAIIEILGIYITSKKMGKFLEDKIRKYNVKLKGRIGIVIIVTLVLTLFIFYTNVIVEYSQGVNNYTIRLNGILFLSYFVLLLIIMYILLSNVVKEVKLDSKENEFQSLQEYTSKLEKLHRDMRSFRHDYINILLSMFGYIQDRNIDGLEKFFNEKVMPLSRSMQSNNFKISLLQNIEVPEIKGMFSAKIIRAQEIGIDVYIDIAETIKNFNMDIIDLSRVIGILLDNSIEAAEKCDKPSMKVALVNKTNSILIVIINNYNEEVPPIYKIYERGFSTKGENRGIGLSNLTKIVEKYDNVSLDTIIEDGEFKQIVAIGNKIEGR